MSWNEARSTRRIKEHQKTVPEFDEKITLAKHTSLVVEARRRGLLDTLPNRRAFVVEGAHLYGRLLDFDSIVADNRGEETENSHRQILQFLDIHTTSGTKLSKQTPLIASTITVRACTLS